MGEGVRSTDFCVLASDPANSVRASPLAKPTQTPSVVRVGPEPSTPALLTPTFCHQSELSSSRANQEAEEPCTWQVLPEPAAEATMDRLLGHVCWEGCFT